MKRLLLTVIISSLTLVSHSATRQDSLHIMQLKEQILNEIEKGKTFEIVTKRTILGKISYQKNVPPKIDELTNRLLTVYQKVHTAQSPQYAEALTWCAWTCVKAGDIKQACKLLHEADKRFSKYGHGAFNGHDTINQIFYNDVRLLVEEQSERDYTAIRIAKKNTDLKRQYFGEESHVYLNSLLDLSRLYASRLSMGKSRKYHNLGYNTYIDVIKNEFCSTSESERTLYWNTAINYINKTLDLAYRQSSKTIGNTEGSLSEAAYNSLLLSKGLLLNTSISFEQFVSNCDNPLANWNLLYKKQRAAEGAPQSELDSLDYVILDALKYNGQKFELPQLSITWCDVANKLNPDDVAIEFYRTEGNDYGAVVIKKGWKSPKCLRLTNTLSKRYNPSPEDSDNSSSEDNSQTSSATKKVTRTQLLNELLIKAWIECYGPDSVPSSNLSMKEMRKMITAKPELYFATLKLYEEYKTKQAIEKQNLKKAKKGQRIFSLDKGLKQLRIDDEHTEMDSSLAWTVSKAVWTDELLKYFPQTSEGRVYFSADGEMQVTGIEFLPFLDPEKHHRSNGSYYCLADLFPIYRLSSTRELTMSGSHNSGQGAAIYGGLVYSMGDSLLIADNERYKRDTSEQLFLAMNGKTRGVGGLYELEGSLTEADTITQIINHSSFANLKATSYTKEIGTEASFKAFNGGQVRLMHLATHGFYYSEKDSVEYKDFLGNKSVHPMSRSGLMMSGSETKFYGGKLPEKVEDGILTSLEISNLDLRGLDLVTLSACQTGQGDIGQDGVFGLQRGFKMASANSIMMSLWKVDDEATQAFMTCFYSKWMSGQTKHQAFEAARNSIRSDSRWLSPEYWAAFILLDALD